MYKVYADLRAEASRTYISFLWWVIEPLVYMVSFYAVFAIILERRTADFAVFLLVGLTAWKWFASSVLHASSSIIGNHALMSQVYLPKVIFPLIVILTDTVKFAVTLLVMIGFLLIYNGPPGAAWLTLPLVLLAQFVLLSGIACLAGAVTPLVPDTRILLEHGLFVLMFFSGVFFGLSDVPEPFQLYFSLNPMAVIIDAYRTVLLEHELPRFDALLGVTGCGVVFWILAIVVLHKFDRAYPRYALQ